MEQGMTVGSANWQFTALSPRSGDLSGDRNEDSLVLLFQYGSFRMLFTGDLEGAAEQRLAETDGERLWADVLKVSGIMARRMAAEKHFLPGYSRRRL